MLVGMSAIGLVVDWKVRMKGLIPVVCPARWIDLRKVSGDAREARSVLNAVITPVIGFDTAESL